MMNLHPVSVVHFRLLTYDLNRKSHNLGATTCLMNKLFLTLLLCFIGISGAGAQVYNFKNYDGGDGFQKSVVKTLYQDRRGSLWIGTVGKGLTRFDSHHFYVYGEEQGLLSDSVNSVVEDVAGNLWIGTERGLFVYDGKKINLFKKLGKHSITALLCDKAGNVWIGTGNAGLYKFDGASVTPFKTTVTGVLDKAITCLYLDASNNLWIGSPRGVARYAPREFKFFSNEPGLASNAINAIAGDLSGNVWLATDAGLTQFDGKEFTSYSIATGGTPRGILALTVDGEDNFWCGTSSGVLKYNGESTRRYELTSGQAKVVVNCAYEDDEGNLWFGTSEGLTKLDSERFTLFPQNDQMGQRVYSVVEALSGNILCGTSLGGTTVFNGRNYSLVDAREGFTSSVVQCFHYSRDSSLWIGTHDDGIYQFSKSGTRHYTKEDGLMIANITGFAVDSLERMWIASADSGVVVVKVARDSLYAVKRFTTKNGLASNRINALAYDGEKIWLGTDDQGLIKLDSAGVDSLAGLAGNYEYGIVHAIVIDSLQRVYVATSRGIKIYNGTKLHTLTTANGLSANNIYSLVIDNAGNLWAGTEDGVDMIPLGEKILPETVRHFGAAEGFKGVEVYRNASCVDRHGNIWFGTVNGLVKYSPSADNRRHTPPKIAITGLKLFFDNIQDTKYGDSVFAWFPLPVKLDLPYNQNDLTFSFAGIYHRHPGSVRYKWILEGFSKTWSPPMTETQAVFSNIPPGHYTFKVIACNEDNVWNEQPASFSFSITPPVWQRWWFRAGALLVVLAVMWTIFYIRLKRIEAKNKAIQERLEMEKSILELEQEAARLQMNPHFIFNCLNSIQGFISTNDPFQAKKYLAKFAKLMRLILENAREEFIPLENEIDILQNYMELEKLSTHQGFEFSITHDDTVDPQQIQIPPMLFQPFVENAIIHGLKKKATSGMLSIHFTRNSDVVVCTIRDNGVGRKQAAEINGQTRGQHKSTAIPVTQKRLEQYGAFRKVNTGVQIIDLEEDGKPSGTEVIVATPYELS